MEEDRKLMHSVRTHLSVEKDSRGVYKPKISIEIYRETYDGRMENINKLLEEQIKIIQDELARTILAVDR
ncbi:MAG: hypothetical protein QXN68_00490 [Thermoplasmata archaeon]